MGVRSRVARWGGSLAVRIPKPLAEQWGVREGSAIELVSRGEHVVMRRQTWRLEEMLERITADNLHPELDAGPARGNEEW